MRRLDHGPSRRERRKAWKGIPSGRRVTHPVRAAYGRGQALAAAVAAHSAWCAERRAFFEAGDPR